MILGYNRSLIGEFIYQFVYNHVSNKLKVISVFKQRHQSEFYIAIVSGYFLLFTILPLQQTKE
jgi:hypothetical protein